MRCRKCRYVNSDGAGSGSVGGEVRLGDGVVGRNYSAGSANDPFAKLPAMGIHLHMKTQTCDHRHLRIGAPEEVAYNGCQGIGCACAVQSPVHTGVAQPMRTAPLRVHTQGRRGASTPVYPSACTAEMQAIEKKPPPSDKIPHIFAIPILSTDMTRGQTTSKH